MQSVDSGVGVDLEAVIAGDPDATPDAASAAGALAALARARWETAAARKVLRKALRARPNSTSWGTLGFEDPWHAGWEERLTQLAEREAAIDRALDRLKTRRPPR
jgi:hypothetical protein